MSALILIVVALCAVLPSCYVGAALPALLLTQSLLGGSSLAIFHAGPVEVMPTDLVVIALLVRCGLGVVARRQLVADRPLYLAIGLFLAVNLLASVAASVKFGEAHFLRCLTTQARFIAEIAMVPVMAQAVTTRLQAERSIRIVLATLAALAAIQFINFAGASHGFIIGEVQGLERGEGRYFGPVGDSVGFVLLLGYVVALCSARLAGAALFLGGILLTAGLGTIFATALGTVLFLGFGMQSEAMRAFIRRRLWLLPLALFAAVLGVAILARPMAQTLMDRVSSGTYASSGSQRLASAKLATAMILDNPVLGVGYMGYEAALARYGGDRFFDLSKPDGATANANNQILQTLTDAGVLGLLALGALLFCAARLLWSVAKNSDSRLVGTFHLAAFLWLLTLMLGNLAAAWLLPSSYIARFLWIILGTAVAVARLRAEPAVETDEAVPMEALEAMPV